MTMLNSIGFSKWPFGLVPPTESTSTWLGRPEFKANLDRVVAGWGFRTTSSIYLLWADFGAGKTHAMRYLEGLGANLENPAMAVYAELPSETMDFLGVYQQIVRQIPESSLRYSINKLRASEGSAWLDASALSGDRDTPRVLWQLSELPDDEIGDISRKWLSGGKMTASELRRLGGVAPIKTSNDALRVLSTLQRMLVEYGGFSRFVLLLDEFQRVGQANRSKLRDVNAGLHRFFNNCPENLSIFLSYSIGLSDAIKHLVTEELMSRIEEEMSLNMLSATEATEFVKDTIRNASENDDWNYCITEDALEIIVERLGNESGGKLTPRRLMQVFGNIFESSLTSGRDMDLPITAERAENAYRTPTADNHV